MKHHQAHVAVEVVDHTGKAAEKIEDAKTAARMARAISGTHAFHKYDWLKGVPPQERKRKLSRNGG